MVAANRHVGTDIKQGLLWHFKGLSFSMIEASAMKAWHHYKSVGLLDFPKALFVCTKQYGNPLRIYSSGYVKK